MTPLDKIYLRLADLKNANLHTEFVATFYPDNTLVVIELHTHPSTKKIDVLVRVPRGHYTNPLTNKEYQFSDISIGGNLKVGGLHFVVIKIESKSVPVVAEKKVEAKIDDSEVEEKKEKILTPYEELNSKIREVIKKRGGSSIRGLGKHFRILDDSNDMKIQPLEFRKALYEYGFNLNNAQIELLTKKYDRDGDGTIDYDEFLRGVMGDMNEFRRSLVIKAFMKLDANKNSVIDTTDIQKFYSTKQHPKVLSGELTEQDVLNKYLDNFDSLHKDGKVTYEEFEEYYNSISCSIDNDEYFALMMHNAWNIE